MKITHSLVVQALWLMGSAYCVGIPPTCVAQESQEAAFGTRMRAIDVSGFESGHTDRITIAAFSRDGRKLATCDCDTLMFWDVTTGRVLWKAKESVDASVFSEDDSMLITVGRRDSAQTGCTVTYWEVESGRRLRTLATFPEMSRGNSTFSPDGTRIVVAIHNISTASLVCWSIQSAKVIWKAEIDYVQPQSISYRPTIVFSPDGKKVAVGTEDGICVLFDATDGRKLVGINARTNRGDDHGNRLCSLAFSPDGKRIVAGCGDGTSMVWNVKDGKRLHRWQGHSSTVGSVAFSADGRTVATGSWDNNILLWHTESGKQLRILEDVSGITRVAFAPGGRDILTATWFGCATLWNVESGQVLRHFGINTGAANCAVFSPDGTKILAGYDGPVAVLWDTATGKVLRSFTRRDSVVYSVAFRRDSEMILIGYGITAGVSDGTAILWNVRTGKQVRSLVDATRSWMCSHSSVGFAPDGKSALVWGSLWNLETGRQLWSFARFPVCSSQLSPDGCQVLMGGGLFYGAVALCTRATGREQLNFGDGSKRNRFPSGTVHSVTFSPDGTKSLVGANGGVTLWDTTTGNLVRVFRSGGNFTTVAFSRDGRRVLAASSEDNAAVLWDTTSGQQLRVYEGHSGVINGVAFSPDGQKVLTASSDKSLILWDMETGEKLRVFTAMIDRG